MSASVQAELSVDHVVAQSPVGVRHRRSKIRSSDACFAIEEKANGFGDTTGLDGAQVWNAPALRWARCWAGVHVVSQLGIFLHDCSALRQSDLYFNRQEVWTSIVDTEMHFVPSRPGINSVRLRIYERLLPLLALLRNALGDFGLAPSGSKGEKGNYQGRGGYEVRTRPVRHAVHPVNAATRQGAPAPDLPLVLLADPRASRRRRQGRAAGAPPPAGMRLDGVSGWRTLATKRSRDSLAPSVRVRSRAVRRSST